jgi:RNA polymerase sigma-70 factor (ECF subfamily)
VRSEPLDSEQVGPDGRQGTPSQQLDRQWALGLLQAAAAAMRVRAERLGEKALRRIELLQLRFQDNLPIREIAARWQVDAAALHHQYAKARDEFRAALLETLAAGRSVPPAELEAECERLLQLLAP